MKLGRPAPEPMNITLKSFLGQQTQQRNTDGQDSAMLIDEEDMPGEMLEEDFYEEDEEQPSSPASAPAPQAQKPDTFRKLMGAFVGQQNQDRKSVV